MNIFRDGIRIAIGRFQLTIKNQERATMEEYIHAPIVNSLPNFTLIRNAKICQEFMVQLRLVCPATNWCRFHTEHTLILEWTILPESSAMSHQVQFIHLI